MVFHFRAILLFSLGKGYTGGPFWGQITSVKNCKTFFSITKQEPVLSENVDFAGAGPGVSLDLEPPFKCSKCNAGYQFYWCLLGSSLLSGLGKKLFGPPVDSKFVSMRKA